MISVVREVNDRLRYIDDEFFWVNEADEGK